MIVAVVILSIILLMALTYCVKITKLFLNSLDAISDINNEFEEIQFIEGFGDIPEEKVLRKFEDAILFCKTIPSKTEEMLQVFDTSLYMKNKVIGLTYFVPEQNLTEVKQNFIDDKHDLKTNLRKRIERMGLEISDEEFEALFRHTAENIDKDIEESVPLIPHCTVLLLKDGRWLWRKEED